MLRYGTAIIVISLAMVCCAPNTRSTKKAAPLVQATIQFSGFTWLVTDSKDMLGPGPNKWEARNVWVDDQGRLHLRLAKDDQGNWSCASLHTSTSLGLGEYEFQVEGRVDQLDRNVVFGLFNYSGEDQHDEMDIEIAHWGRITHHNLHYTVYPKHGVRAGKWTAESKLKLTGSHSTHRLIRSGQSVIFQSHHGFSSEKNTTIFSATCNDPGIISLQPMPVHINLWLFNGRPPAGGNEAEIIIHRFRFTPL